MSTARSEFVSFGIGSIFGLGLSISQMVNPSKVIGFLDVTGSWDPSLALVMGAALAITLIGYRLVLRGRKPLLEADFYLPDRRDVDGRLLSGAALFGIGWGMAGYCPGPAISALALIPEGTREPIIFVAAMIFGSQAARHLHFRSPATTESSASD